MSEIFNSVEYNILYQKFCFLLTNTSIQKNTDRFERLHQLTNCQASQVKAFGEKVIDLIKEYEKNHQKNKCLAMVFLSKAQDRWLDCMLYKDNYESQQLKIVHQEAINLLNKCLSLLPQTWSNWSEMSVLVEAFCLRATFFYLTENFTASLSDCHHATEALLDIGILKALHEYYHAQPDNLVKLIALELILIKQLYCDVDGFQSLLGSLNLTDDINFDDILNSDTPSLKELTLLVTQLSISSLDIKLLWQVLTDLFIAIEKRVPKINKKKITVNNFNVSKMLRLESSDQGGRFYVANEHLTKGQSVLKERPYSLVIFYEHLNNYCGNCYKNLITSWPCLGCTEIFFCSANCARQAYENFHHLECGIFGFMLGPDNFYSIPHVYRLYTQFGVECATHVEMSQAEHYPVKSLVDNYIENNSMKTQSFNEMNEDQKKLLCRAIFSLLSHRNKRDVGREVCHTLLAFALVFILKHRGQLGDWLKESKEKDDENQVEERISLYRLSNLTECIATAMMRTSTNGFCWSNTSQLTDETNNELTRVASCLCLVASFVNHSCSPNVIWKFDENGIEMKMLRSIEPGEPLTICYGPRHSIPFDQRQQRLKDDYLFFCRCELCLVDSASLDTKTLRCLSSDNCAGPLVVNQYHSCLTCGLKPNIETSEHLKRLLMSKKKAIQKFNKLLTPLLTKAHRTNKLFNVSWSMCLPLHTKRIKKKQPLQHLINKYPNMFNDIFGEIKLENLNKLLYQPEREPIHMVINAFVVDRFKIQAELSLRKLNKIRKHYVFYNRLAYGSSFQNFSMLADIFYLNHRHECDQHSLDFVPNLSRCLESFVPAEIDVNFKGDILRLDYISIYLTYLATKKQTLLIEHFQTNLTAAATFRKITIAVNTKLLALLRYDLNERGHFFPKTHCYLQIPSVERRVLQPPKFDELSLSERFFARMYQHCQARLDVLFCDNSF